MPDNETKKSPLVEKAASAPDEDTPDKAPQSNMVDDLACAFGREVYKATMSGIVAQIINQPEYSTVDAMIDKAHTVAFEAAKRGRSWYIESHKTHEAMKLGLA